MNVKILQRLSDGKFHSTESLQEVAGSDDLTVYCSQLAEYGLTVERKDGYGYRLNNPPELLDREQILSTLEAARFPLPSELIISPIIDSTNKYLLSEQRLTSRIVCLAEFQTAGRGRQGRQWLSPYGSGLCLSIRWLYKKMPPASLSLALGIALVKVFRRLGATEAGVKWPNDVLWHGHKLSGLLVESRQQGDVYGVVAGVGININLPADLPVEQAIADVNTAAGRVISRNQLAAEVIQAFFEMLTHFESGEFARFMQDWAGLDILYDKEMTLLTPNGEIQGIGRGVDETGALLLSHNGKTKSYTYGEARIKR